MRAYARRGVAYASFVAADSRAECDRDRNRAHRGETLEERERFFRAGAERILPREERAAHERGDEERDPHRALAAKQNAGAEGSDEEGHRAEPSR